jgi:hypothetical protein
MNNIIIGALFPMAISALFGALTILLKRENTHKWGFAIGRVLSPFFGRKTGKEAYEKFEGRFQTTIYDFCLGVIEGLDADDELKWKGPVE